MTELSTFTQETLLQNLPNAFNYPIVDYFSTQVYCLGYFRKPNQDEINRCSKLPFAIFENAEPHGWKVFFYSKEEVLAAIEKCKPI